MVHVKFEKVTLIFPNYINREKFGDPSDPPLGIAYIAAVLRNEGYKVSIIDANAENLSDDNIIELLKQNDTKIVAISCNYSPLHNPTITLSERIKTEFNIPIIVGGNHATAMAEKILSSSYAIDYIVLGEGERTVLNLVKALENNTPLNQILGVAFREDGKVCRTPDAPLIEDLDQIPDPAYDLLPMKKYNRYNIITSRGCPFKCTYCASNIVFRRRVRYRSPIRVLDEIEFLIKKFGLKHFWFSDDTFTTNTNYTISLLDEMQKRSLKITWSCLTRIDVVKRETLEKMKKSGCSYISYGIESGNQHILDEIGKNITTKEILEALNLTHDVGIPQYGFFIVGFPGETRNSIMDDFKLIMESKLDGAAFNILIPLPGTKMMDQLVQKKLIDLDTIQWDFLFARTPDEAHESYSANLASKWTDNLTGKDLVESCIVGHYLPKIKKYLDENSCD
jgi:radical SAM superfamily enzyme YgiQ (UPF0313 family)